MDTARQIIRWALPGWLVYFFLMLFVLVTFVVCDQDQQIYIKLLNKANDLLIPLAAVMVPLGFLIYQMYYWLYWYAPIPFFIGRFIINPVDRGREILDGVKDQVDFKKIFDHPLNPTDPVYQPRKLLFLRILCKDKKVMQKYRENWHLSDSAWYWALADKRYASTAGFLEKRNQMIGDIYHSLGASYTALILALFGYLLLFTYITIIEIPPCLGGFATLLKSGTPLDCLGEILRIGLALFLRAVTIVLNLMIFVGSFGMFKAGRMASFDALLSLKHDVITTVMLDKPEATKATQLTV